MMDKIDVNGITAHPVYHYLKKVAGPVSQITSARFFFAPSYTDQIVLYRVMNTYNKARN